MTFSLKEGEKFACVAFANVGVEPELLEQVPLDLGDDIRVLDRPHFDFPSYWREWIGSIKADRVSDSNLLLLRKRASKIPAVLDHENKELIKEVESVFHGIVLQGMPQDEAAYRLTGAISGGKSGLRQFTEIYDHHSYFRRFLFRLKHGRQRKLSHRGLRKCYRRPIFFGYNVVLEL
jgi:hypothetical protein